MVRPSVCCLFLCLLWGAGSDDVVSGWMWQDIQSRKRHAGLQLSSTTQNNFTSVYNADTGVHSATESVGVDGLLKFICAFLWNAELYAAGLGTHPGHVVTGVIQDSNVPLYFVALACANHLVHEKIEATHTS